MPCCFPQHLSWAAWEPLCIREGGEKRKEETTDRRHPFISDSHPLPPPFSLFRSLKSLSLSQFFFCLPSSASQRRVISQHDVLCCEFSTRHANSPPLPLHRHSFFETHCAALSKYWRLIRQIVKRRSCPKCLGESHYYPPLFCFLWRVEMYKEIKSGNKRISV